MLALLEILGFLLEILAGIAELVGGLMYERTKRNASAEAHLLSHHTSAFNARVR